MDLSSRAALEAQLGRAAAPVIQGQRQDEAALLIDLVQSVLHGEMANEIKDIFHSARLSTVA